MVIEEIELRNQTTIAVQRVLFALRGICEPDAKWSIRCDSDVNDSLLTIYSDHPDPWALRDAAEEALAEALEIDGIAIILVIQPKAAEEHAGDIQLLPV